jgi:iron(III) transport system ATP-binding protein
MEMKMKLEIENISLNLDIDRILDNLTLAVKEEEIISIIGPSASGKSSLLRVIAGFENISSGKIKLNGQIVDDTSLVIEPQKRNVGIIFQDLALFPHLNCAENITFGISKLSSKEKIERLQRLEKVLDITEISTKFPHEISGGQQQRVAIARALAPKPEILLLDEPFSALDENLKEKLLADVKILLKEEKITTIRITHNIKEAFQISDKIAFLNNKKIMQFDSAYNIYHKPLTREIANFCGIGSFINGEIIDANHVLTDLGKHFGDTSPYQIGSNVDIMIRPDDVIHDDNSTKSAQVIEKIFHGSEFLYKLKLNASENIFCYTPSHHDHAINEVIGIKSEVDHLILFSK